MCVLSAVWCGVVWCGSLIARKVSLDMGYLRGVSKVLTESQYVTWVSQSVLAWVSGRDMCIVYVACSWSLSC
jgi:hypothetical protein